VRADRGELLGGVPTKKLDVTNRTSGQAFDENEERIGNAPRGDSASDMAT
jgi:hypothetical protein